MAPAQAGHIRLHTTDFSIIAVDAPGFGKTSVFDGGMTGFADEVIFMLTALRAQPFLLVGHSMGGMLAQIIAAKSNAECFGLMLSCTHKGRGLPTHETLSEQVRERIEQRRAMTDADYGELRIERMLSGRLSNEIYIIFSRRLQAIFASKALHGGVQRSNILIRHPILNKSKPQL